MKTSCSKCGSSDANHIYEDGHTHCFSCGTTVFPNQKEVQVNDDRTTVSSISSYKSYPITSRGISHAVVDHFKVRMETDEDGRPAAHYYPYTRNGAIVAYKRRGIPKDFSIVGDFSSVELFGQASSPGDRTLVITEGEIDCLSVAEAFQRTGKRIYPIVALPSATGTNTALKQRDYINGFEKVVLLLDNDEAGREATERLAKIIKIGKCFVGHLPEKDVNETLLKHGPHPITRAIWNATEWSPAGIVTGESVWSAFKNRQDAKAIPYPDCLRGLNEKLIGMREGEITLFTSGTGSGKSTVIKEIILDLLERTTDRIGLISLEESIGDTAEKFISMALRKSVQQQPPSSEAELRKGYEMVFKDERLVLLDHQGSVGDESLLDKIEYMALMGCKFLVLDHITIAVSEGVEGRSGNEAIDKVMSDLLKVVKRHNVWLGLISHLRKTSGGRAFEEGAIASLDDIKGSGSIKQIAFDVIAFARDMVADDDVERNTIHFRVLKSRFTGRTGPAGAAIFNPNTNRLSAAGVEVDFEGL